MTNGWRVRREAKKAVSRLIYGTSGDPNMRPETAVARRPLLARDFRAAASLTTGR